MARNERTRRRTKRVARTRPLPLEKETEPQRVYLWRLRCLERAGMTRQLAKRVAGSDFDLTKALDMLEQGCSPELLLDIAL